RRRPNICRRRGGHGKTPSAGPRGADPRIPSVAAPLQDMSGGPPPSCPGRDKGDFVMAVARRPPRPAPGPEARCRRRPALRFLPTAGAACLAGAALLALLPGQALPLLVAAALLLALGREAAVPASLLLGGNPLAVAAELVLL